MPFEINRKTCSVIHSNAIPETSKKDYNEDNFEVYAPLNHILRGIDPRDRLRKKE